MIDKFLRRFCAQEVRIMIAKMEEDYSEFTKYRSVWGRLLEATTYLTRVEKYCVKKAKYRAASDYDRQQYLGAILKQQLNPMTMEEVEDTGLTSKSQYIQQMQMAQQRMMNQAQYGTALQGARNIFQGNQP